MLELEENKRKLLELKDKIINLGDSLWLRWVKKKITAFTRRK